MSVSTHRHHRRSPVQVPSVLTSESSLSSMSDRPSPACREDWEDTDEEVSMRRASLVFLLAGSLAGCATYREQPLSSRSTLPNLIPDLTIDPRQMPLPE